MSILAELLDDVKFIYRYRSTHMKQQKKLNRKAPKAGDIAPDFTLSDVTGMNAITLSGFRGKNQLR